MGQGAGIPPISIERKCPLCVALESTSPRSLKGCRMQYIVWKSLLLGSLCACMYWSVSTRSVCKYFVALLFVNGARASLLWFGKFVCVIMCEHVGLYLSV